MATLSSLISSLPSLSLSASGPAVPLKRTGTPTSSVWSVSADTSQSPSAPTTPKEDDTTADEARSDEPPSSPSTEEPDEIEVADWIQSYSDAKRLTPSRANDILEKAMRKDVPEPPDPDECCGSSCCPCVKDLWLEEVGVWHAVRNGETAEEVANKVFKAKK